MPEKKTAAPAAPETTEVPAAAETTEEVAPAAPKRRRRTAKADKPAKAPRATRTKAAKAEAAEAKSAEKADAKPARRGRPPLTPEVYVELGTKQYNVSDIVDRVKADYRAEHKVGVQSCKIYIKPEEGVAYYVVNKTSGKLEL